MVASLTRSARASDAGDRTDDRASALVVALCAGLPVLLGAAVVFDATLAWGLALVVVLLIAVLERPAVGGLLLVAVVPVTSGIAAGVPFPMVRPSEAAVLGLASIYLLLPLRRALPWNHLDWAVAAYCIGSIALAAFHEMRAGSLADEYPAVIAPIELFLLYRVVATTVRDERQRDLAVAILFAVSIPVSVIGILQQFDVGPTRDLVLTVTQSGILEGWGYQNLPRATSIFADWHTFGGYLAVVLLLGVATLTVNAGRRRRRLAVTAMGFAAAALALTSTFTSIFGVAFGTLLILRRERAWHLARWVVVLAGIAAAFFGSYLSERLETQWIGRDDSGLLPQTVDYRIEVWTEQYFPLIGQYWPLGYGTGIPPEIDWVYTESGYLTLLFRGGVGLLVLAAALIVHSHRLGDEVTRRRGGTDRALGLCSLAIAVALVPMNLIWPYLTNAGLSQAFFVVLALARTAREGATRLESSVDAVVGGGHVRSVDDRPEGVRPVLP